MPNEISGIKKGAIIKAADIYSRYNAIIQNLISKANDNVTFLSGMIRDFLSKIDTDSGSEQAQEAFQYLSSTKNAYWYKAHTEINDLRSQLSSLEMQWYSANGNENSAHGGIEKYWSTYTNHESRKKNPLHVIERDHGADAPTYAADGRVNQSDFIGAYHFKNTVESLYAIASRLRDIYIEVGREGKDLNIIMGQRNPNPYRDLSVVKKYQSDLISSDKIDIDNQSHPLSASLIPFGDWILNNELNGRSIRVGDDAEKMEHGWVSSDSDPYRYPNELSDAVQNANYFLNLNRIGNQITRTLRDRRSELPNGTNESTMLTNFYYNNKNVAGTNPYGLDSEEGITKEYLTLKFGTDISTYPSSDQIDISSYSTPSDELSNYFQRDVAESYVDGVLTNNVIRSKTCGKNHIVCAQTVNDMFKQMNLMLVQISASLYGRYEYMLVEGQIENYGAGNPKGGLGYPEIMSWYSGGTAGGSINFLNTSNAIQSQRDHTETYSGTLGSKAYVANEVDEPWASIRCGYPGMTQQFRETIGLHNNAGALRKLVYTKTSGSTVPMAFNGGFDPAFPQPNGVKSNNIGTIGNPVKSSYFFGTSEDGVYKIKNSPAGDANRQVFTRYCISHPIELSAEHVITSDAISGIYTGYRDSSIKNVDINAKYLFMPYMMYLDDWYVSGQSNITVGTFLNNMPITVNKSTYVFSKECGMPVQQLNRDSIWMPQHILSSYDSIDVGLFIVQKSDMSKTDIVGKDYSLNVIDYAIKGVITVNEVNHTHEGYSKLDLYVQNSHAFGKSLSYLQDNSQDKLCGVNTNENILPLISTYLYYGYNNYNAENDPNLNAHLSTFYRDAINSMFYDRYKFNDFYDDYDLLATDVTYISDVSEYFTCGGRNTYLGGNKTMFWNWIVKKPLSSGSRELDGSKELEIKPYFSNTAGSDGKNMIQGNFYFSGNHSNEIDVSQSGQKAVNCNGLCHYKYVPMPAPVTISSFNIDINSSTNNIVMKGFCPAWWNNLARFNLSIKFNDSQNNPTISSFSASHAYQSADPNYPERNKKPFSASQIKEDVTFGNVSHNTNVSYKWENNRFNFDISCSCDVPDDYGTQFDISCEFTNEDGGSRYYSGLSVAPPFAPSNTVAWYTDGSTKTYSVNGQFTSTSISTLTNIAKVRLGNTITSIASSAFESFPSSLTAVTIPSSVTSIGNAAFRDCSGLLEITIPSGVTNLGSKMFYGCTSLSSIRDNRSTAQTVGSDTFGDDDSNYTGRNTHSAGTNILYVPQNATGYDADGTYWKNTLLDSDKCGFTIHEQSI